MAMGLQRLVARVGLHLTQFTGLALRRAVCVVRRCGRFEGRGSDLGPGSVGHLALSVSIKVCLYTIKTILFPTVRLTCAAVGEAAGTHAPTVDQPPVLVIVCVRVVFGGYDGHPAASLELDPAVMVVALARVAVSVVGFKRGRVGCLCGDMSLSVLTVRRLVIWRCGHVFHPERVTTLLFLLQSRSQSPQRPVSP
ncbi:hypothetical protein EGW08_006992, partial [Elysia chlorotica]